MATLKTRPNDQDVNSFIRGVDNPQRQEDAWVLLDLFKRVTGRPAVMWGDSIVGFGSYAYTNSKGNHSWLMTGFSPRKQNLSIYVMQGFENFQEEIAALGKVKTAKSCLYITRLSKIDLAKLEGFMVKVVADMEQRYPCT